MYKLEIKKGGTYSNLRSPPLHVGGDGFEPPKRDAADLQSAPFGHSGNHPFVFNPTLAGEPLVGFEPTTPRLQITCSGQLS